MGYWDDYWILYRGTKNQTDIHSKLLAGYMVRLACGLSLGSVRSSAISRYVEQMHRSSENEGPYCG